jgi:hypothetical protein
MNRKDILAAEGALGFLVHLFVHTKDGSLEVAVADPVLRDYHKT